MNIINYLTQKRDKKIQREVELEKQMIDEYIYLRKNKLPMPRSKLGMRTDIVAKYFKLLPYTSAYTSNSLSHDDIYMEYYTVENEARVGSKMGNPNIAILNDILDKDRVFQRVYDKIVYKKIHL